MMFTSSST